MCFTYFGVFFFLGWHLFFKVWGLPRMEQYLGSGGPACLWMWICVLAWLSCACELLYQSIDGEMSSLNVAAVLRNLELVWTQFLG